MRITWQDILYPMMFQFLLFRFLELQYILLSMSGFYFLLLQASHQGDVIVKLFYTHLNKHYQGHGVALLVVR